MRPYENINIGDIYRTDVTGSEWVVVEKNDDERMIKLKMLSVNLSPHLNRGFWKRNTNSIFYHRVLIGNTPLCRK